MRPLQPRHVLGPGLEAILGAGLDLHGRERERAQDLAVGRVARRAEPHARARVEQRREGQHEARRGTRGDDHPGGVEVDAVPLAVVARDARAQRGQAERHGVAERPPPPSRRRAAARAPAGAGVPGWPTSMWITERPCASRAWARAITSMTMNGRDVGSGGERRGHGAVLCPRARRDGKARGGAGVRRGRVRRRNGVVTIGSAAGGSGGRPAGWGPVPRGASPRLEPIRRGAGSGPPERGGPRPRGRAPPSRSGRRGPAGRRGARAERCGPRPDRAALLGGHGLRLGLGLGLDRGGAALHLLHDVVNHLGVGHLVGLACPPGRPCQSPRRRR